MKPEPVSSSLESQHIDSIRLSHCSEREGEGESEGEFHMALVRLITSRKLSQSLSSRIVNPFELTRIGSVQAAFFSTQKLIGDEPVLVSFRIWEALIG